jgi:hypothetical protein
LTLFGALLGIAFLAPLAGQQAITGSVINAVLFVSTALLGIQAGILIGLIPGAVSVMTGLLPLALAPMVPFIVISNAILVVIFSQFRNKNYWLGIASASILKYLFLFTVSSTVIDIFLKKETAYKAALMMSWPQLATALTGGIIAYFILKSWKKLN